MKPWYISFDNLSRAITLLHYGFIDLSIEKEHAEQESRLCIVVTPS